MENDIQPPYLSDVPEPTKPRYKKYILSAAGIILIAGCALWYGLSRTSEPVASVTHTVTIETSEGGISSPSDTTVPEGGTVSYSFTPNAGYRIVGVLVDGATTTATSSYTLRNITGNHHITVAFAPVHYSVRGDYVYFKDALASGVDAKTFTVVSDYFGKDRQGVFYAGGERLTMADTESFQVLDAAEAYAIDSELVFFASSQIFGADAATFKALGDQYAIDKNNVYTTSNSIPEADVATFAVVGNGYAQDKNNIYYLGQLFTLAQHVPLPIGFGYSANADAVFYNGFKVEGADRATFTPLSSYYAKDKTHVYYQWEILPEADPVTFKVIRGDNPEGSPHVALDSKRVYREFSALPLDPKTVHMEGDHFLADKQTVYFTDTPVVGADAKTFKVIGGTFGTDVHGLWSGISLVAQTLPETGEKSTITYQYLGDLFATDGVSVYRGTEVLENADPTTFNFIPGTYYAHDKQNVYYGSELIAENAQGLIIFGPGAAFAKTTSEVFRDGAKIEGADPVSFTVHEDGYRATDKNRQYNLQEELYQDNFTDWQIEASL